MAGKSKKEDGVKEEKRKRDGSTQPPKSSKPPAGGKSSQQPSAPQQATPGQPQQGSFVAHKEIKLTLLNKVRPGAGLDQGSALVPERVSKWPLTKPEQPGHVQAAPRGGQPPGAAAQMAPEHSCGQPVPTEQRQAHQALHRLLAHRALLWSRGPSSGRATVLWVWGPRRDQGTQDGLQPSTGMQPPPSLLYSPHQGVALPPPCSVLFQAADKGSRKRYEPSDKDRQSPPAKRANLSPDRGEPQAPGQAQPRGSQHPIFS